jgi:hypothetical protein
MREFFLLGIGVSIVIAVRGHVISLGICDQGPMMVCACGSSHAAQLNPTKKSFPTPVAAAS